MSHIIGIMPCRNSAWVLGLSARALLHWVDGLIILNHASTDGTLAAVHDLHAEHGNRVEWITVDDPQWTEMAHRQSLLGYARALHATHIVTIDDDEVLTHNLLPKIRECVETTPPGSVLQIPWLCMRGGIDQVQVGGIWGDQDVSIGFLDAPECHWASREGYDFHHRHPMGRAQVPYKPVNTRCGRRHGLMHLQFSSERRLRAKQALYQMTEVIRWPGREPVERVRQRYSLAVHGVYEGSQYDPHAMDTQQAPAEWWAGYEDLMRYLDLDAIPWQESECKRLWAEHGAERFAGLDLFGVI